MSKKKKSFRALITPFEEKGADWSEYPRPQMKRDSYLSLCGCWELYSSFGEKEEYIGSITVPFVPESRLSGIFREKSKNEKYIYKKSFTLGEDFDRGRVLLHFGAADQTARVWVNGKKAGEHVGGYLPFSFEIGSYLKGGENSVTVEITDTLDCDLPYGKQREKRGGMWYTPISGIWQAVWLESVPAEYIRSLRITPALDSVSLRCEGGVSAKHIVLQTEEGIREYDFVGDSFELKIDHPLLWTPEEPNLYYFTLFCGEDKIESYFALRTVTVEKKNGIPLICLNNKPYFFHGLLDQGYFPDGIYTPASPEGYKWDILEMKRLGFNTLRKHIKLEPELFYYYCDKYGMIVFQDMVNSGRYSFLADTALPTVGLKRGISHRPSEKRRAQLEGDMRGTVSCLYNHPSVCYYTIFNEGWGQYDADRHYRELKALDPTRVWDATSGWFFEKESDVRSEHIYFKKIKLKKSRERPLVLSEFGGYSLKIEGHCFNTEENYGYKSFETQKDLTEGLRSLYLSEIVPEIKKGLCAVVLTQLSDVEDETNGICTYDRRIIKPDGDEMRKIAKALNEAFGCLTEE